MCCASSGTSYHIITINWCSLKCHMRCKLYRLTGWFSRYIFTADIFRLMISSKHCLMNLDISYEANHSSFLCGSNIIRILMVASILEKRMSWGARTDLETQTPKLEVMQTNHLAKAISPWPSSKGAWSTRSRVTGHTSFVLFSQAHSRALYMLPHMMNSWTHPSGSCHQHQIAARYPLESQRISEISATKYPWIYILNA